jgi:hypothetical protein
MVNAGMVNGAAGRFLHAAFRENFGVLGRFSSFKTTVKYDRRFAINHKTEHLAQADRPKVMRFIKQYQCISIHLKILKRSLRYNGAVKETGCI